MAESQRYIFATNALYSVSSQYIASAFGLATTILASRWLGPTQYGVVVLILSYPSLLRSFLVLKTVSILPRYLSQFRGQGDVNRIGAICKLGYAIDLAAAALVLIIVSMTGWIVAQTLLHLPPKASWAMALYATSFLPCALASTSRSILLAWEQFRSLALLQVAERLFGFLFVAIFLGLGWGVVGFVWALVLENAMVGFLALGMAILCLRREGMELWWKGEMSSLSPLLRDLRNLLGLSYLLVTLTGIMEQVPPMILGRLRGPEDAGFYRIAFTFINFAIYAETSLARVIYPRFCILWSQGNRRRMEEYLREKTIQVGIPLAFFTGLFSLSLNLLIPLLFGASYQAMIFGNQIMMLGVSLRLAFFGLTPFYYALGRLDVIVQAYLFCVASALVIGWLLAPYLGFLGMAYGVAVGWGLLVLILATRARRTSPFEGSRETKRKFTP